MRQPTMAKDKIMHLCAGLVISLLVSYILDPFTGFIAAAFCGFAKEIWDYYNDGCSEPNDFIVTMLGGFFGSLIIYIVGR